jgi:threonine/homoserine/homoserine lactone efflux protein
MPLEAFISFALVDLLLVMTPGADWAFAIAVGVKGDRVMPAISGLATGYLVHVALVVAGLGAVLTRNTDVLGIIAVVGATYLLWLGIAVLRRPAPIAAAETPALSPLRSGLQGVAVSGLNPKGLLLFFALLPQFVALGASWPVPVQLAALGLFHVIACALAYTGVAIAASRLLRSRPRAALVIAPPRAVRLGPRNGCDDRRGWRGGERRSNRSGRRPPSGRAATGCGHSCSSSPIARSMNAWSSGLNGAA